MGMISDIETGVRTTPRAPVSLTRAVLLLALWLLVAANWPLWLAVARAGGAPSLYAPQLPGLALVVACGSAALLALGAFARVAHLWWLLVILVAAGVQHYMLAYHVVIDPTMVANVMQTNVTEVRDLLGWRLLRDLLLVAGPPAVWLWRVELQALPWPRQLGRNALLVLAAVGVMVAGVFASYRQLAPLMRNEPQLRYMINPLAPAYSLLRQGSRSGARSAQALATISAGTTAGPSYAAGQPPPLFVLVVGETARADHFGLNGYARDTTPELARASVLSWRQAQSCGTSTAASVPCMFSHLGREAFEARRGESENLLDVLQAAGLAVLWVDNQAGCKGVCDRVPHASTADRQDTPRGRALCEGGECLDDMLLEGLDERIAQLPAERRARGTVVVLHQMGSHGPAYYRRSDAARKRLGTECRDIALDRCAPGELVNAFDHSIAYTDHFLAGVIDWLRARQSDHQVAMLYMSDHGESLGEYGLYLHGMPYAFAPAQQKHVPLVFWAGTLASRTGVDAGCLAGQLDAPASHDNLYPTLLGLLDVASPTYRPALDLFGPCRAGGGQLLARRS